MKSNWKVTYNAGEPWSGPGPFERYVDITEGKLSSVRGLFISPSDSDSVLVRIGESISFHPSSLPAEAAVRAREPVREVMRVAAAAGVPDDTPLMAMVGRAIAAGPKLFRPTARQCEPLEQVEVGLIAAECNLPFPVCVVEFPLDYATNRILPSPTDAAPVRPGFLVALQENGGLAVGCVLPEVDSDLSDFVTFYVSGATVEAVLERVGPRGAAFAPFIRAALNFLLLAAGGHRPVGPSNPSLVESLRKRLRKAERNRRTDRIEELRARLRQLSCVYSLAQEIRLFDHDRPTAEPDANADGSPKTPHWRKGHWRRVAVGAGRTERKPVFIRPVLVNGHLLPRKGE